MHWGVRKKRDDSAFRERAAKKKKKQSPDYKKTVPLRNRKTPELSNEQLALVNKRINLEQNYSRLNPNKITKGKVAIAGILATATMATTAYNLFNSPAGKHLLDLGKKRAKQLQLF